MELVSMAGEFYPDNLGLPFLLQSVGLPISPILATLLMLPLPYVHLCVFVSLLWIVPSASVVLIKQGIHVIIIQTVLSSRLLSKNLKIKIYKTIILAVVKHGLLN